MAAYYNENDPKAAAWLRELIKAGEIARGEVDERDIRDVTPKDLKGFTQAHFFAGIGGWSKALRLAGWPDSRPVWTGSCPCQSFSSAGKRKGFADERHLWPAWHWLIEKCRPPIVFGEQVADAIRHGWLDLVSGDLEGSGYAVAAAVLAAGGLGAPHLRKRLWFVAHANHAERRSNLAKGNNRNGNSSRRNEGDCQPDEHRTISRLADAQSRGLRRWSGTGRKNGTEACDGSALGDASSSRLLSRSQSGIYPDQESGRPWDGKLERSGSARSPWFDCDWIYCTDGKWRPVEPGTFPLAHGIPARLGRLRGYGNAIVPQVAAEFIRGVK